MKRVLVVDDSATVRQQVGMALKQAGYDVCEACDGLEGAQKIAGDPQIAMVICDVNMPRMDGLAMLEKIRAEARRPTPPVIMLTTEGKPELIQRAKSAGAKGWIIKPFKAELLVAAVGKLVGA
jgi:two-component system, chemotaxis family, chemotaxis protein CheY